MSYFVLFYSVRVGRNIRRFFIREENTTNTLSSATRFSSWELAEDFVKSRPDLNLSILEVDK
jgi:hypothetical protein